MHFALPYCLEKKKKRALVNNIECLNIHSFKQGDYQDIGSTMDLFLKKKIIILIVKK